METVNLILLTTLVLVAVLASIWHIYATVQMMGQLETTNVLLANIYAATMEYDDEGWDDGIDEGDDGAEDEREAARWN